MAAAFPGIAAVVLAGGEGTRLGRDKLRASLGGAPLLAHAVRAALTLFEEVRVVDKDAGRARSVLAEAGILEGGALSVDADRSLLPTPLAGLEAGLLSARAEAIFACAGDMPFACDERLISALRRMLPGQEAVCALFRGTPEPLAALYLRAPCSKAASALLARGPAGPRALLQAVRTAWVEYATIAPDDSDGTPFLDADTPEALAALGERLRRPS